MPTHVQLGLAVLTAAALVTPAPAQTQTPASKAAIPTPKAAVPGASQVLATVNGEPITKAEVVNLLGRVEVPTDRREEAYRMVIDELVRTHLLTQFLREMKIVVPPKEVDDVIAQQKAELARVKSSLEEALAESSMTAEDLRAQITRNRQWRKFVEAQASDAALKAYLQKNREALDGTLVRASHILLKLDPGATSAAKEQARQKLLGIKKEIESGKISFADAANKFSEDDGNIATPNGGDLNFFPLRGQYVESFTKPAFALKKGQISDPIETEYGLHLIHVTDRRPGREIDLAQNRDRILALYAEDLQADLVANALKTAKVEIKPMPADLFPAPTVIPSPSPAPTTGGAATKPAPR